jgi:hypothetical protein
MPWRKLYPYGYEEVVVSTVAIGLFQTVTEDVGGIAVQIQVGDNIIRYTVDGTTPTSSLGFVGLVGDNFLLNEYEAKQFKAIRQGAADGRVRSIYYKKGN